jgi:hypothetical protein
VTTPLRAGRAALAFLALGCAAYVGARADSQKHRATEIEVVRALLDSSFAPGRPDSAGLRELMLYDHFDNERAPEFEFTSEWLRDSLPEVPRGLARDFWRVATDDSRIAPFELGRSRLHLLADSTLARFFGRRKPGWEGFRRTFPRGGSIVSVSRVGLSRDGHWAMVYAGSQGDWLAGAGFLYVLYSDGGIWRVRHRQMLWIS